MDDGVASPETLGSVARLRDELPRDQFGGLFWRPYDGLQGFALADLPCRPDRIAISDDIPLVVLWRRTGRVLGTDTQDHRVTTGAVQDWLAGYIRTRAGGPRHSP